jgi:hypothetical protein
VAAGIGRVIPWESHHGVINRPATPHVRFISQEFQYGQVVFSDSLMGFVIVTIFNFQTRNILEFLVTLSYKHIKNLTFFYLILEKNILISVDLKGTLSKEFFFTNCKINKHWNF